MKMYFLSYVIVVQCQFTEGEHLPEVTFLSKEAIVFCVLVVAELFENAFLIHRAEMISALFVPIDSCVCPPVLVVLLLFLLHWAKEMFAHTACLGSYFCSCLRSHIELNLAVITFLLCLRQVLLIVSGSLYLLQGILALKL